MDEKRTFAKFKALSKKNFNDIADCYVIGLKKIIILVVGDITLVCILHMYLIDCGNTANDFAKFNYREDD